MLLQLGKVVLEATVLGLCLLCLSVLRSRPCLRIRLRPCLRIRLQLRLRLRLRLRLWLWLWLWLRLRLRLHRRSLHLVRLLPQHDDCMVR